MATGLEAIRNTRKALGFTQADVAAELNIRQPIVAKMENGDIPLDDDAAAELWKRIVEMGFRDVQARSDLLMNLVIAGMEKAQREVAA